MTDLSIVYEDATIVVVNKPSGLLSVPGRGPDKQDCIVNRLKAYLPHCMSHPAVHRLDMDTSGLMVLATTAASQRHLAIQFQSRTIEKLYFAVVEGVVKADGGVIQLAFRLDITQRPRQIHDEAQGKMGITRWRKLAVHESRTYLAFSPLTGRTHQLRVHAAHELGLGCAIVGDRLYGTGTGPGQLLLHAARLNFEHPDTGRRMEFSIAPPFETMFPWPLK